MPRTVRAHTACVLVSPHPGALISQPFLPLENASSAAMMTRLSAMTVAYPYSPAQLGHVREVYAVPPRDGGDGHEDGRHDGEVEIRGVAAGVGPRVLELDELHAVFAQVLGFRGQALRLLGQRVEQPPIDWGSSPSSSCAMVLASSSSCW